MRAVLVLVLAAACGGPSRSVDNVEPERTDDRFTTLASIERFGCFGWCPMYIVTVFRDGGVAYEGREFVKVKGAATGRLSPTRVAELERLFTSGGFMAMKNEYTHVSMTDSPSVRISFRPRSGELEKMVKHYLGDETAPYGLRVIEDTFDRIVMTEQWIGTEAERDQLFGRH